MISLKKGSTTDRSWRRRDALDWSFVRTSAEQLLGLSLIHDSTTSISKFGTDLSFRRSIEREGNLLRQLNGEERRRKYFLASKVSQSDLLIEPPRYVRKDVPEKKAYYSTLYYSAYARDLYVHPYPYTRTHVHPKLNQIRDSWPNFFLSCRAYQVVLSRPYAWYCTSVKVNVAGMQPTFGG